jgi:hypothetical protein
LKPPKLPVQEKPYAKESLQPGRESGAVERVSDFFDRLGPGRIWVNNHFLSTAAFDPPHRYLGQEPHTVAHYISFLRFAAEAVAPRRRGHNDKSRHS